MKFDFGDGKPPISLPSGFAWIQDGRVLHDSRRPISGNCRICDGRGWRIATVIAMRGPDFQERVMCEYCHGYGHE